MGLGLGLGLSRPRILGGESLFKYQAGDSLSGGTFTRASAARYRDVNNVMQSTASGVPRDSHYALNNSNATYERSLLLEGQRTNICLTSENQASANWTLSNVTVSANSIAAPDGTVTADTLFETVASAQHQSFQGLSSLTTSVFYTWTAFIKANGRQWAILNSHNSVPQLTWFDVINGTVGTVAAGAIASIEAWGNGWFRCRVTILADVTTGYIGVSSATADGVSIFVGDITKGVYVWGTQVELGPCPSSYIATVASSVIRAADALSFPFTAKPQELSAYIDYIQLGVCEVDGRILQVGLPNTDPRLIIFSITTQMRGYYSTLSGNVSSLLIDAAFDSRVENIITISAGGAVNLIQSVNGAASSAGGYSANNPGGIAADWSAPTLTINDRGDGTAVGFGAYRRFAIYQGTRDLTYFRALFP